MSSILCFSGDSSARLTAERDESKYLLPDAAAPALAAQLALYIAPHRHDGAFDGSLERAQGYATTVYFDTARRELWRAAAADQRHVKVRVREYHDYDADPRGPAVDPERALWIELKFRDGTRSGKRRARIAAREVDAWLRVLASADGVPAGEPTGATGAAELAHELARIYGRLSAPLAPSCVVRYRRLSFQDDRAELRITLDRDVCAYPPPAASWGGAAIDPARAPAFREARCVLEVKRRGALPAWIDELIRSHGGLQERYSKFVLASRAVHGA